MPVRAKDKWSIIRAGATVSAVVLMAGLLWNIGDYTEVRPIIKREFNYSRSEIDQRTQAMTAQLDQANQAILLIQFQLLMQKREYGGLTFDEQQELCRLAYALGYVGVPGCPT